MTTIPPQFKGLADKVSRSVVSMVDTIRHRGPSFSREELAVAFWLRGDKIKLETLTNLLIVRIQDREKLPVPSNPHDAHARLAAIHETREFISELERLYAVPLNVTTGTEDEDDG